MKKLALVLLGASLFVFASCGSKAPEETAEEPVAPSTTEVVEEPEEQEAVEEPVIEKVDDASLEEALASLDAARNKALESGAEDWAGALFLDLEERYNALKERAANGEDVSAECETLARLYDALSAYSKAQQAKVKIDENELATYDQSNYDEGVLSLEELETLFEDEDVDPGKVSELAEKSFAHFNKVIVAAYRKLAKDARAKAFEAKKDADSVKAGVSQKERYKACVESFQKGDSLFAMQDPEDAFRMYVEAWEGFDGLYKEVSEKRAAALAAIQAAKAKVAESEDVAAQADLEAPIKDENQEGIEDEDAVLLEEDEYEDPAQAEADIAATLDDEDEDETDDAETEVETESEEEAE